MGHRESVDLDFFSPRSTFNLSTFLGNVTNPDWHIDIAQEKTVYGRQFDAKISFISYPFFKPSCAPIKYGSIRILDIDDIAVMKIIAISQRGKKRDFIDLYEYIQKRSSLYNVLLKVPVQYSGVTHDFHHLLKTLIYFSDADDDTMPKMKKTIVWDTVKKYFVTEVSKLSRKIL